jgi:ParB family chromosome partitioning protein
MKLPESVRRSLSDGSLSAGHGRALLALADPEAVARKVVSEGLTVRDVERMAQQADADAAAPETKMQREKDPDTRALEQALEDVLGLKVDIRHKSHGGGQLSIRYATLDQLDGLCRRLKS